MTQFIRRSRAFQRCLAVAALLAFPAGPVLSHPHVWVTGATTLKFQDDKLATVGMRWQFDAFFSQVLTGDFDTDKDGKFDAAETAAMKEQVFTSLREYGYFTHLRVNGTEALFDRVENFSTTIDKGELVYIFDLILPKPIDLTTSDAMLSVFDPSLYVDIVLGGDKPLVIDGMVNGNCNWSFATGDEIANDNGMLTPQVVKLSCKTKT